MTRERLAEIYYNANTNKCESTNFFITKFLPKHKMFCRTTADQSRVYLAISITSIGYPETLRRLYRKLGVHAGHHCMKYFNRLESRRSYYKVQTKTKEWKKKRAARAQEKWREKHKKELEDKRKALDYRSGMAMAAEAAPTNTNRVSTPTSGCSKCGSTSHKRSSSRLCPFNRKNVLKETPTPSTENNTTDVPEELLECEEPQEKMGEKGELVCWDLNKVRTNPDETGMRDS